MEPLSFRTPWHLMWLLAVAEDSVFNILSFLACRVTCLASNPAGLARAVPDPAGCASHSQFRAPCRSFEPCFGHRGGGNKNGKL